EGVRQHFAWAMAAFVALFLRRQGCSSGGFRGSLGAVVMLTCTAVLATGVACAPSTAASLFGCTSRRHIPTRRTWAALCCQASAQRSLQTAFRNVSSGLTLARLQCMPAPFRRASTTTLLALSTIPLPIGQPAACKVGYCIC